MPGKHSTPIKNREERTKKLLKQQELIDKKRDAEIDAKQNKKKFNPQNTLKMKTPMDMKTPMKANKFIGAKMAAEKSGADSFTVDGKSFPLQMKEPMKMGSAMKMKSPAKMGTAYKMDKSAFKMKNGPMKMYGDKAGSMAKMAGVMKMKTPMDMKSPMNMSPMKETDVTEEYKKKGNPDTRKHIESGGKVIRKKDGSLILTK